MAKELAPIVQGPEFRPPAVFAPDPAAAKRFLEFFIANIRNPNTRRAYWRAVREFAAWWEDQRIGELQDIEPVHIATYVETLQIRLAAPSVKVHLAAVKMLFDWLVIGQVLAINPAAVVRGPKHSVKQGSTPVLSKERHSHLAGLNRHLDNYWPARPRADRADDLHLCSGRRGHQNAGRRRL